ncbi:alpha/beta hydrolase [Leptospira sarikeiensis]|uniref:Alpha/beta hydrolase n=1 Tax=Leptospira sarikeiensis TaxID=2484943 RepID=A0A4R9KGN7_9LEPT|nr:alpha/beta hydrolase [Leptospira sarikeiensis]TGL64628.1 alpha/beta hydrolase [Leptospira sarikeiensis]
MIEKIHLMANEVKIAGDLYLPEGNREKIPAVIMAPGFGGVKEMLIPHYAKVLLKKNIATLAIDYPNFGESEGNPRQHIDIKSHHTSYYSALDYLSSDSRFDPKRLGIWGSSLSGGHSLVVAATDHRVKSIFAIIPYISPPLQAVPALAGKVFLDLFLRKIGSKGGVLPIAGRPGEIAAMNTDGAWEWMLEMTSDAPTFKNYVTLASLLQMTFYRTSSYAKKIQKPLKVILAMEDSITPAKLVKNAIKGIPNVVIEEYPETHFELFREHLNTTIESTALWFSETL